MAAVEVSLLSSPLPAPATQPSSPSLPSPSALLGKSRHFFNDATLDSCTEDGDVRSTAISLAQPAKNTKKRVQKDSLPKKPPVRRRSKAGGGDTTLDAQPEATAKKGAKSAPRGKNAAEKTDENAPKKTRALQTTIKKGRVRKAAIAGGPEKLVISADNSFSTGHVTSTELQRSLEGPTEQRGSQTPPINSIAALDAPDAFAPSQGLLTTSAHSPRCEEKQEFADLCESFGFDGSERESLGAPASALQPERLLKKRRIELVGPIGAPSLASSSPKAKSKPPAKATKKKPRTITEQATAHYAVDHPPSPQEVDILQYFPTQGATDDIHKDGHAAGKSDRHGPTKTRPARKASGRKSKKDPSADIPPLLSPRSAARALETQQVSFGTSSQLARDISPSDNLARPTEDIEAGFVHIEDEDIWGDSFSPPAKGGHGQDNRVPDLYSGTKLWSAAARDEEGQLAADAGSRGKTSSHTAVVGQSDYRRIQDLPAQDQSRDLPSKDHSTDMDDEWHRLEDDAVDIGAEFEAQQTDTQARGQVSIPAGRAETSKKLSDKAPGQRKKQKAPAAPPEKSSAVQANAVPQALPSQEQSCPAGGNNALTKPNYEGCQTAQLSAELASYGFKPVKSRKRMIELLEKCWQGKQRVALKALGANTQLSHAENAPEPGASLQAKPQAPTVKPSAEGVSSTAVVPLPKSGATGTKKTARKPREDTAGNDATQALTPASGSEHDRVSSSRPRGLDPTPQLSSSAPISAKQPRSALSQPANGASADTRDTTADQKHRFACITRAVKAGGPLEGGAPSWHVKMLMYDPIILEDLALWLNTKGLDAVGEDFEVGPAELKEWCKAKGICCLWKENLRGGERRRY